MKIHHLANTIWEKEERKKQIKLGWGELYSSTLLPVILSGGRKENILTSFFVSILQCLLQQCRDMAGAWGKWKWKHLVCNQQQPPFFLHSPFSQLGSSVVVPITTPLPQPCYTTDQIRL